MEHIGIVGLDHGVRLQQRARGRGVSVQGYDRDAVKIAQIPDELDRALWSSDESSLEDLHAYIISTPTPIVSGARDMRDLREACTTVGAALTPGALVILESPVDPGVSEQTILPILEKASGLSRYEFLFAHCPLRDPSPDGAWHVLNTPRAIGALTSQALARSRAVYSLIIESELFALGSVKEAELVHLLESAFADMNAALANELAMAIRDKDIDFMRVMQGAATKPWGFLATAPGFVLAHNGADPLHTLNRGMRAGSEHRLLAAAHKINHGMPGFVVRLLTESLRDKRINAKKAIVALLGLDTPLSRGPVSALAEAIKKKGMSVRAFDPRSPLQSTMRSLETTLPGVKAVIIARADPEFCALTPQVLAKHGISIVIDACNCLDKEAFLAAGILYRGIGR